MIVLMIVPRDKGGTRRHLMLEMFCLGVPKFSNITPNKIKDLRVMLEMQNGVLTL